MDLSALFTSAGINIGICVALFSLYSVLRKQPSNVSVYFGRNISKRRSMGDPFSLERFVPSPSWLVKAWETTEEELLELDGLDSVIFIRMIIFSIRIFSIAAIICCSLVLPMNYFGKKVMHRHIPSESLEVLSIDNIPENSKWLWAHCLALYVVSFSAYVLLYFEHKRIIKMRLAHITSSDLKPSDFTVLVLSLPRSPEESYSESVTRFFKKCHGSSYLSHLIVHQKSTVRKLMSNAERMCQPSIIQCGYGWPISSFKMLSQETDDGKRANDSGHVKLAARGKERAAAFVFFKTRYAADVASQIVHSANPMTWVTESAPEPHDVLWSSLNIPYRVLWIRRTGTILASIAFMLVFLLPVTLVQSLTQLQSLQRVFPFLRGILKWKMVSQLLTGYLPSVIFLLFLLLVPPLMMLFSKLEGPVSRSKRKMGACVKVLYFYIWNVFFFNILSGSFISQLTLFFSTKDIPTVLAKAVPTQANFFMTYVLTSGWASLAIELMQVWPLILNIFNRLILRNKDCSSYAPLAFPYHTEVPKVLLFGLLGFTFSVFAPLILPLLLVYFFLAYLVYRNQILNVYTSRYDFGGGFWPIAHNCTIFSMVFTQAIAMTVFGIKRSPVATGFTGQLIVFTLLFHVYCRQRFLPIFGKPAAETLIDMDRKDEQSGKMEEFYEQLPEAYCRVIATSHDIVGCKSYLENLSHEATDSEISHNIGVELGQENELLTGIENSEIVEPSHSGCSSPFSGHDKPL